MRYGIEQYFVEQGRGLDMEERMGRWGEIQIPLEVEVALGHDGTAVTRGYRWSELGIKTEVVATPRFNGDEVVNGVTSPKLKITIQNVSNRSLGLVDNPRHCNFYLESEGWSGIDYQPVSNDCENYQPLTNNIIRLAPEQSHEFNFDLSEMRWHMRIEDRPQEIGVLRQWEQFRLVYQSPHQDNIPSITNDTEIWIGELPSQAFFPSGRID